MQQTNEHRRARMRLAEVERIIRRERILVPPPSRSTLIGLIEDGTFEATSNTPTTFGWLIYEDSFRKWVRSLDGDTES